MCMCMDSGRRRGEKPAETWQSMGPLSFRSSAPPAIFGPYMAAEVLMKGDKLK